MTGYRNRVVVALVGADLLHLDRFGRTAEQVGQQVDDFRGGLFFVRRLHFLTKICHLNGLSRLVFLSGFGQLERVTGSGCMQLRF